MAEIRDKARQGIIEILVKPLKVPYQTDAAEMMVQGAINQAEEILSIPEIAIVDREAELPKRMTREAIPGDMTRSMELNKNISFGYEQAQQDMRKAGWVKEIKD